MAGAWMGQPPEPVKRMRLANLTEIFHYAPCGTGITEAREGNEEMSCLSAFVRLVAFC